MNRYERRHGRRINPLVSDHACWCGFYAQEWTILRDSRSGSIIARLPVCWAHRDPAGWPVELKVSITDQWPGTIVADGFPGWWLSDGEYGVGAEPH